MLSLGREPQDGVQKKDEPRSGDRIIAPTSAAHAADMDLPPLRGCFFLVSRILGLTPQAMNMSLLRSFFLSHLTAGTATSIKTHHLDQKTVRSDWCGSPRVLVVGTDH